MGKISAIAGICAEKKRGFIILFLIEVLAILLGVINLFGKDAVYEYDVLQSGVRANFGVYSEEQGGIYADSDMGTLGNIVDFTNISLPKGTYRIQLYYSTDTDMVNRCYVSDDYLTDRELQTNGTSLFSGLDSTDFDMWLYRNTDNLIVHVEYNGQGEIAVSGLTIRQTNASARILLFKIICIAAFINCVCLYVAYDRKYHISVKNKTVAFILGVAALLAAFPLITDYMISAGDLGYHLMRVEGIKDGILAGQFPIRISPEWQQGYGYASPIFYGETVLYIAALFRLIGFTVTTSYRLFMALISVATVLIAYECFKRIFNEAYVGVFCSLLYSTSIYRIYKTYYCGSWGECFGIMILPLILYGFYRVFTQDIHEKSYKRSWIPLTAGFSLLIQSHLLTCELVGVFTIILCIVMWKKVFRKETFIVLAKTVIYSILLSAWFLIPFADYMMTGDFVIQHVSGRTIQARGLFIAHLFLTFFRDGGTVFFDTDGMADSAAVGVGMVLMVPLLIWIYMVFSGKTKTIDAAHRKFGYLMGSFAVVSMVMSLSLFPWDRIHSINQITATLVSSIQFPNRFLTISNVTLTAVAGLVAKYVSDNKNTAYRTAYFAVTALLLVLGNIYIMNEEYNDFTAIRVYNNEGMGTGYISGAEYLPYGAEPQYFMYKAPVCTEAVEYTDYEKLSLGASMHVVNKSSETEEVELALLYYKGYQAYAAETGEKLECHSGSNCVVTVDIPGNFEGDIVVKFVSPWYWRAGELITVVTLAAMLIFAYKFNNKNKYAHGRENLIKEAE